MQFVRAGAAFLFVDPRFKGLPHLWVILNNPSSAFADGKVIAVSFVTARSYTDATVILQPGDHPFIRHATSVDYGGAKLWRVEMIEHEIGERRCHC
ncbi:MAG TPA: hypothetical protein VFL95_03430 [Gemmatimonadales bacterium]|nr:hypothetical protein [Gemmatimonadales bacterium]